MRRAVLLSSAAVLALGGDPAAAAPRPISQVGFLVQQFDVAGGGALRSATVWSGFRPRDPAESRGVYGRLAVGSKLRHAQRLDRRASDPKVAVGADGSAVAVWKRGAQLRYASAPPGGRFGATRTLVTSRGTLGIGGVAISIGGRTVIAWSQGDQVRAAIRRSGRFGAPTTLGRTPGAPSVAGSTAGQIVVSWQTIPQPGLPAPYGLAGAPQVQAAVLAPGATAFGALQTLSARPQGAEFPIAAGGRGGAAVTWTEAPGHVVRRVQAAGTFGSPAVIRPGVVGMLALAVPRSGNLVAAWSRASSPDRPLPRPVVEAAVQAPDGTFPTVRRLSDPSYTAEEVAAGDLGDRALLVWKEQRPGRRSRLRAALRSATAWSNAATISDARAVGAIRIGTGTRGAVIAWVERERTSPGRLHLIPLR